MRRLQTPVVHEVPLWRIAVNRNQNLLGRMIVVLQRHEEAVDQLTPAEWTALGVEVRWLTERLRRAFSPDHFNYAFLQNQDRHVHLHVIPRYASVRRLAGLEFADPDYPGHYRAPVNQRVAGAVLLAAIEEALS